MTSIRANLPQDNAAVRQSLYEGAIFKLAPTGASRAITEAAKELLRRELGGDDIRDIPGRLDPSDLFSRIGRIRYALFMESYWHGLVRDVLDALGFDSGRIAFDPLRLRTVLHRGHDNPAAAAVYYTHRDTWYAHPMSAITWWIPLDDLSPDETFVFYPEKFRSPVPNNSEIFDYDAWVRDGWSLKIGWQDPESGRRARYPGVTGDVDPGPALGFSCRAAENLLFSGVHFHRTLKQATGRARFSLDFRTVFLDDEAAGLGAPNVDGRARGTALPDYACPVERGEPAPTLPSPASGGG